MKQFNLNMDCGEYTDKINYFEKDEVMMPFLTYCNVACGGHCGNEESMQSTLQLAKKFNVLAGAHPSYVDKVNFGRKSVSISKDELKDQIISQIQTLEEVARQLNLKLSHVKPHGALYNDALLDQDKASAVVNAILNLANRYPIMTMPNTVLAKLAKANGLYVIAEGFADRTYASSSKLTPRSEANAILLNPSDVIARIKTLHQGKLLDTANNLHVMSFDTLCIHGDHPNLEGIVELLMYTN